MKTAEKYQRNKNPKGWPILVYSWPVGETLLHVLAPKKHDYTEITNKKTGSER